MLAGGLSSRMGTDKAQLMRNNTSMLDFSQQLLRNAGINNIVISGNANQINQNQQVTDIIEKAGPVGGIYSVIKQYQPKALLVLPVDLPLMTAQALTKLKQIGELSGKACFFQNHSIPLYLPINGFLDIFLQQAFTHSSFTNSGRGPSIKALLNQVPHQAIAIENQQTLFNTNTPEQWQQAKHTFTSKHQGATNG